MLVDHPSTTQEKLSHTLDALLSYLCMQREVVLDQYKLQDFYRLPQALRSRLSYHEASCAEH